MIAPPLAFGIPPQSRWPPFQGRVPDPQTIFETRLNVGGVGRSLWGPLSIPKRSE